MVVGDGACGLVGGMESEIINLSHRIMSPEQRGVLDFKLVLDLAKPH